MYKNDFNYYNPAAGLEDDSIKIKLGMYLKTDNQSPNAPNYKPRTYLVSYAQRLKSVKGIVSVYHLSDKYSYYYRRALAVGYAHIFPTRVGVFRTGVRGVVFSDLVNWGEFGTLSNPKKSNYVSGDLDLGAEYLIGGLQAGVGAKNVLGSVKKSGGYVIFKNRRQFFALATYKIIWNSQSDQFGEISSSPHIMVWKEGVLKGTDVGMNFRVSRLGSIGYTYRIEDLRHILIFETAWKHPFNAGISFDGSFENKRSFFDFQISYKF